MTITLNIDEKGNPYLLLESVGVNIDDQVLELFIKKAYKQGIEIVNKTDESFRNDYASIRLKENKED